MCPVGPSLLSPVQCFLATLWHPGQEESPQAHFPKFQAMILGCIYMTDDKKKYLAETTVTQNITMLAKDSSHG